MDQSSWEGDAALYSRAPRPSAGTSQNLLLPSNKATSLVDPQAGPNPHSPWMLQLEAVRKDSSGAIINTGRTANTSLRII